jgi:hypothetical protein
MHADTSVIVGGIDRLFYTVMVFDYLPQFDNQTACRRRRRTPHRTASD